MTKLRPVTPVELERLVNLYAMSPLETNRDIDVSLARKGWVLFDGLDTTIMSPAAYRKDNGRPCLYEDNGTVAACWKMSA